jgi:hypothetical protein
MFNACYSRSLFLGSLEPRLGYYTMNECLPESRLIEIMIDKVLSLARGESYHGSVSIGWTTLSK